MNLQYLLRLTGKWLDGTGRHSDIVVSSRVRMARNLEGISFPNRANRQQSREVIRQVTLAAKSCPHLQGSAILYLNKLSRLNREILMERHLISYEHATGEKERTVIIANQETVSIMINEEDHIRLQCFQSGLELEKAFQMINSIDNTLAQQLNYAFSPQWGFLTACPTNVGTGMRTSILVHLPGLVMMHKIQKLLQTVSRLGLFIRGFYGEGSEVMGNLFQISNQVTLGQSEQEIIGRMEKIAQQVVIFERSAREVLLKNNRELVEDKIWRAHSLLSNARIINSEETLELLSAIRLGINLNILKYIDIQTLNEILLLTQPAHLQMVAGKKLSAAARDIRRAEFIRKKLKY